MTITKVMLFYGGYLPGQNFGGPVTSIFNFTEALGDELDLYIVTKNHDMGSREPYAGILANEWNTVGKARVFYLSDPAYNKDSFLHLIEMVEPDILYASSIFSASVIWPVISIAKQKNIPFLLAPRGELNPTALKRKAYKKIPYLTLLKLSGKLDHVFFQGTSAEEARHIAQALHIPQKRIFMLANFSSPVARKRKIFKEAGTIRVLSIARIVSNKNLKYALQVISKVAARVEMDIFGPIEQPDYWQQCEALIHALPKNISVTYRGQLSPAEARDVYLEYDCLLFPTLFENYGQVIAEAISHDCVPIISKGTTPWDDVNDVMEDLATPIGDDAGFIAAIEGIAAMNSAAYSQLIEKLRDYGSRKMNTGALQKEYTSVFSGLLNEKGESYVAV